MSAAIAAVSPPKPFIFTQPHAPAGHALCMHVGGVWVCECGKARMSRAALVAHHDDVREDLARAGAMRARAAVQKITLAEIEAAYRKAGGE